MRTQAYKLMVILKSGDLKERNGVFYFTPKENPYKIPPLEMKAKNPFELVNYIFKAYIDPVHI